MASFSIWPDKVDSHNSIENAAQSPLQGCAFLANGAMVKKLHGANRNASLHPKEHSVYRTPTEDWIVIPVAPIVDEDLFEAAQEVRTKPGALSSAKTRSKPAAGVEWFQAWLRLCSFG